MNSSTYFPKETSLENSKKNTLSPEVIALLVFAGFYVFARIVEIYLLPLIPEFFTREISAIFRWGPVLVPIVFGITFYSKKPSNKNYDDNVLKERMMMWAKK